MMRWLTWLVSASMGVAAFITLLWAAVTNGDQLGSSGEAFLVFSLLVGSFACIGITYSD